MMSLGEIGQIALSVQDVERATRFYTEVLVCPCCSGQADCRSSGVGPFGSC
jgi:hypothetical protein